MNIGKWMQRFSVDLELKYSRSYQTRQNYHSCAGSFLKHFQKYEHPKEIPTYEIKEYLINHFNTANTRKGNLCGVKAFYKITVGMPDKIDRIPFPQKEKRFPIIIDKTDVQKLFDVCDNLKHKTIMAVLYSTGVRISEAININLTDIRRKEKVIRVIGKGNKERLVPLNDDLLSLIETYYRKYKPVIFLFENPSTHERYSKRSIGEFLKSLKEKAGISSPVTAHKFRHSNATQLLEAGTDIRIIQKLLGHNSIRTTQIYTHVSRNLISSITSPLNSIQL